MMFEESQSSLLSARQHNKAKLKEEQKSYTTMESRALDDKQHEKLKRLLHSRLGQKLIESSSGDR